QRVTNRAVSKIRMQVSETKPMLPPDRRPRRLLPTDQRVGQIRRQLFCSLATNIRQTTCDLLLLHCRAGHIWPSIADESCGLNHATWQRLALRGNVIPYREPHLG